MPRVLAAIVAGLVLLVLASQLIIPPLVENGVEERLTEDGGRADVSLRAFPAFRLLFSDGGLAEIEGSGIRVPLERTENVLERLDGFSEVRVHLDDVTAGPLDLSSFDVTRARDEPDYDAHISGTASPRELAAFFGSEAGGALGGLLGDLAGATLPGGGSTPVPLELDVRLLSRDGRAETVSATGAVAGVPAGPLADVVVEAVLSRL